MKLRTVLIFLSLLLVGSAKADVELDRKTADTMKAYSAHDFKAKAETLQNGQYIKIKFAYRSEIFKNGGSGDSSCQVRDSVSKKQTLSPMEVGADSAINYISVKATSKQALDWMTRLPTYDFRRNAQRTFVAVGRIVKDGVGNSTVLLEGNEIQTDAKTSRIVWRK